MIDPKAKLQYHAEDHIILQLDSEIKLGAEVFFGMITAITNIPLPRITNYGKVYSISIFDRKILKFHTN